MSEHDQLAASKTNSKRRRGLFRMIDRYLTTSAQRYGWVVLITAFLLFWENWQLMLASFQLIHLDSYEQVFSLLAILRQMQGCWIVRLVLQLCLAPGTLNGIISAVLSSFQTPEILLMIFAAVFLFTSGHKEIRIMLVICTLLQAGSAAAGVLFGLSASTLSRAAGVLMALGWVELALSAVLLAVSLTLAASAYKEIVNKM